MQANAGLFRGLFNKKKAFSLLENGSLHFLGSDCHNLTSRLPDIGNAYSEIEKKFGTDFVKFMTDFVLKKLVGQ